MFNIVKNERIECKQSDLRGRAIIRDKVVKIETWKLKIELSSFYSLKAMFKHSIFFKLFSLSLSEIFSKMIFLISKIEKLKRKYVIDLMWTRHNLIISCFALNIASLIYVKIALKEQSH